MASLSDGERQYLEESKGLGNSQKAEVAWLEKQGYAYEEVDVSDFELARPRRSSAASTMSLGPARGSVRSAGLGSAAAGGSRRSLGSVASSSRSRRSSAD